MRRRETGFCPALQATPVPILAWLSMCWSVAGTCEEARDHRGLEVPRPWADRAIVRTTLVLLALYALRTVLV